MNYKEKIPIVVYDNECYLCVKFAKMINLLSRGRITMAGHYSNLGQVLRKDILDESALEMFWFIDKKNAYGGRAALFPLLKAIISSDRPTCVSVRIDGKCDNDCKTAKALFIRSASLIRKYKKIDL